MGLFKHFLLHQYCLNFDREVETMHVSMGIERPWAPADILDLRAASAKEKPKKLKEEPRSQEACDAAANGEQPQEASADVEEQEGHEKEVDRLVAQKLEETRAKL